MFGIQVQQFPITLGRSLPVSESRRARDRAGTRFRAVKFRCRISFSHIRQPPAAFPSPPAAGRGDRSALVQIQGCNCRHGGRFAGMTLIAPSARVEERDNRRQTFREPGLASIRGPFRNAKDMAWFTDVKPLREARYVSAPPTNRNPVGERIASRIRMVRSWVGRSK